MKNIYFLLTITIFNIGTALQSCHTNKATQKPDTFVINVAGKSFEGQDVELDTNERATVVRSGADMEIISKHLFYIAYSANFISDVYEAAKGEKKFLPALWKILPLIISDLPNLINAGNSYKKIGEFYKASGGLTPMEQAQVTEQFSLWLNIPITEASEIVTASIDAVLANMKLSHAIKDVVKPNTNNNAQ